MPGLSPRQDSSSRPVTSGQDTCPPIATNGTAAEEGKGAAWNPVRSLPMLQGLCALDQLVSWRLGKSYCFTSQCTIPVSTLKRKCEIFITGCTRCCQNDNVWCSHWWNFHQNDDISNLVICVVRLTTCFGEAHNKWNYKLIEALWQICCLTWWISHTECQYQDKRVYVISSSVLW